MKILNYIPNVLKFEIKHYHYKIQTHTTLNYGLGVQSFYLLTTRKKNMKPCDLKKASLMPINFHLLYCSPFCSSAHYMLHVINLVIAF